jgi:hypothetical protein
MHAGGTKMTMLLNGRSLTCAGYDRLRLLTRDATLCSLRGTSRPRTDPNIHIFKSCSRHRRRNCSSPDCFRLRLDLVPQFTPNSFPFDKCSKVASAFQCSVIAMPKEKPA